MKPKKKRDPMARELLCSGKYGQRVMKNKKIYSRKEKHKKSSGQRFPELSFYETVLPTVAHPFRHDGSVVRPLSFSG